MCGFCFQYSLGPELMSTCLEVIVLYKMSLAKYLEGIVMRQSKSRTLIPIKIILFVQQAGQGSLLGIAFSESCYCC